MHPFQGHPHRQRQLARLHLEAQKLSILSGIQSPDVTAFRLTKIGNPLLRLLAQVAKQGIVAIEQQHSPLAHALRDFQLGLPDSLLRTQELDMGGTDVDNHCHIRMGDIRKVRNLPEVVHAHFQHRYLRIRRHGQNRHRHTDVIVVIGRGFADPVGTLQNLGDHFLGGALSHGAGHRHHFGADALELFPGDISQSLPRVLHIDGRVVPHPAAAQHRRSALLHGCGNEIMSIPSALEGQEQLSRFQNPGIVIGAEKFHVGVFFIHSTAAPAGGLTQGKISHCNSSILPDGLRPLPVHPGGTCDRRCPDRSHALFQQVQLYHLFSQCP